MHPDKKEHPKEKSRLHPRNQHRERYDFKALIESTPELAPFVTRNIYQDDSIDFFNAHAVKTLNKALLKHHYGVEHWDIPEGYLCPPIPGRADYLHYMGDLLSVSNKAIIPKGIGVYVLDVGVGANCVYPIIGHTEYGWSFTGSDIDPVALASAKNIRDANPALRGNIELRLQEHATDIFHGIIQKGERFDFTLCNPPFHASAADAKAGTLRKLSNLKQKKVTKKELNFGGQENELWCEGGEEEFVRNMIRESMLFQHSCLWFSTLISKQTHLKNAYFELDKTDVADVKTIAMGQGNKSSRVLAWTFLNKEQQEKWAEERWNS